MLKIQHLYKTYHTGNMNYEVFKRCIFRSEKGEFVAVMGPFRFRKDDSSELYILLYPV